ncbi:hypothetical protein IW262DRAFT_1529389 [Armillaria fumosa]|nr:hypothetical protein IW262DRAFT_1529389 [Armillaria fumosa]
MSKSAYPYLYVTDSTRVSPQHELYPIRASPDVPSQYISEAGEAHRITQGAEFVVFEDRTIGTVVTSSTTAFTTTCDFSLPRNANETLFPLPTPGFASLTQVGEGRDVSLLIESEKKLLGVFKQIADEMQAGQRVFRFVNSRNDEPDLPLSATWANNTSAGFYWDLRCSNKRNPFAGKITLEYMKLEETGEYMNDLREGSKLDSNKNLNVRGEIVVDVDEGAIYGYKIMNTMSVPLYVWMFYFDASDLSISSYYQPGRAKNDTDVSLPPGDLFVIGYGVSGTVPHIYILRKGQDDDVGFLKLFFSTEYMDLPCVVQNSPFDDDRQSGPPAVRKSLYLWYMVCLLSYCDCIVTSMFPLSSFGLFGTGIGFPTLLLR